MTTPTTARRLSANRPFDPERELFMADAIAGLTARRKHLAPKYFYDAEGSKLFEEITALPEYYPTRTEFSILREHGAEMAGMLPQGGALVEFGAGACTKARLLVAQEASKLSAYVPVDISGDFLNTEAAKLRSEFPQLAILPLVEDFSAPFSLPGNIAAMPRAGFFPGSTIGNFEPHQAHEFMRGAGQILGAGAVFIVGVDLIKPQELLHAAYNDRAGVTARFNLNLLARMNRELGANFDLAAFEHHALYNREKHRVEMHLASLKRQKVRLDGVTVDFRAGETIHTENSYKYSAGSFTSLARGAGWSPLKVWTDTSALFSVHALRFG